MHSLDNPSRLCYNDPASQWEAVFITPNQYLWTQARDRLGAAVTGIGFSAELAELMARQLGSPKAIDRMVSYIHQARPRTEEMLVDEMLLSLPVGE